MDTLKFTWFLTVLIFMSCKVANSQFQGCSLLGIEIQECINQDGSLASMESCCKTLNRAAQAGYYCLCLLLRSSTPLMSLTLSLQLSNCYISVPPLNKCQESLPAFQEPDTPELVLNNPPARPVPMQIPPEMPGDLMPPSAPADFMVPLPPKRDDIPRNPTTVNNSSVAEGQSTSNNSLQPMLDILERYMKSSGGCKKVWSHPRNLLAFALLAMM